MSYDEGQAKRSRVVVETPTSRREVTQTENVHNDRGGISGATVGVIVVVAIALITIVALFLMNGQSNDNANANLAAQQAQQQPALVQQPAPQQQPPIIIQQPAAAANQPPVIIQQPAATGDTASTNTSNDSAVQAAVDRMISDDATLSALGITATVLEGRVTLTGTVKSEIVKAQLDKALRAVKGVKQVDNQLVVFS